MLARGLTGGSRPALAGLHRTPSGIDAVVITHAHADHTGFAERVRAEAGAGAWVHDSDAVAMRSGELPRPERSMVWYLLPIEAARTGLSLGRRGAKRFKAIPIAEVSTFADGEVIDVPGRPRAVHAPGHTPGNAALLAESRGTLLT
jgi:glyoxylase-like metal-dependent hydrolase (beta-lactamase superfamily II)